MNKKFFMIPFILAKSFFSAVTGVAWGIASMMLLNVLVVYTLKQEIPNYVSTTFLQIELFIFNHIMLFVVVYFIVSCYFDLKELGGSSSIPASRLKKAQNKSNVGLALK